MELRYTGGQGLATGSRPSGEPLPGFHMLSLPFVPNFKRKPLQIFFLPLLSCCILSASEAARALPSPLSAPLHMCLVLVLALLTGTCSLGPLLQAHVCLALGLRTCTCSPGFWEHLLVRPGLRHMYFWYRVGICDIWFWEHTLVVSGSGHNYLLLLVVGTFNSRHIYLCF